MTDSQKKDFQNHHTARTIMLNAISYNEYEKITNRETAHNIFESLKMTHEGNLQVKETKALAPIQKYEPFKMEEEESVEAMFSRFQILIARLRVSDKGYSMSDHVKKVIRSLPTKWRPMVTALKLSKDLNKMTLEELVSSLRSHEIELNEDEPLKEGKSIALFSNRNSKSKSMQALEENSEESSSDEDLTRLADKVNQLLKRKQRKFKSSRKKDNRNEYSGHRRSSKKNKLLMATWEDSETSEYSSDSDKDCALMARMADADKAAVSEKDNGETFKKDKAELSDSESEEVFSLFTKSELADCLSEILEKYNHLKVKYKKLQSMLVSENETLKTELSELKEQNVKLSNISEKAHEHSESNKSSDVKNILNEYDCNFQKFLTTSLNRSKMTSMIYGVSKNNRSGIGYKPLSGKNLNVPNLLMR